MCDTVPVAAQGRLAVRRQSLADRRGSLLKKAKTDIALLKERQKRKREAVVAVRKALVAQEKVSNTTRPLKRFGIDMHVVVVHHKLVKGKRVEQRTMAILSDSIRWSKMVCPGGWLETTLKLEAGKGAKTSVQYMNRRGRGVPIKKQSEFQAWLDEMWCYFPPELHVDDVEALVHEGQERMNHINDIFAEHDKDGSGTLDMIEVRDMMISVLDDRVNVPKEDLAFYVAEEFQRYDRDANQSLDLEEFIAYFNEMQDFVQDSLSHDNKFEYTLSKFKESYVQAHSPRVALSALLGDKEEGRLTVDEAGHKYFIEVVIPRSAVSEDEEGCWVRAQTVLDHRVEYFEDDSDAIGELFTPIVWVEFEEGVLLDDDFFVTLPHCFGEEGERLENSKKDIVPVFGSFDTAAWQEMEPDMYEFIPGDDAAGVPPTIKIRMVEGGLVACFGRSDKRLRQRVQCVSYVPAKIIPLESERLNVYLMPALPDQVHALDFLEKYKRGSNVNGGVLGPIVVRQGSGVELKVSGQSPRSTSWDGKPQCLTFDIDPDDLVMGEVTGGRGGSAIQITTRAASLELSMKVSDIMARRMSVTREGGAKPKTCTVRLSVHEFPPPGPPRGLSLIYRTNNAMQIKWTHPTSWGGCALAGYEVEIQEITNKGVDKEWENVTDQCRVNWKSGEPVGDIYMSIYAGRVRVRAYNCASRAAGAWSELLEVMPEKEEKARRTSAASTRDSQRKSVVAAEAGVATVTMDKDDYCSVGRKRETAMKGWEPFHTAIGEFLLVAGAGGGVNGSLFNLTVADVHELVKNNATDDDFVVEQHPLLALATAGVWVTKTLAHWAEDPHEMIEFVNTVDGLVTLAGQQLSRGDPADTVMIDKQRALLYLLQQIYETVLQSADDGYATKQLKYKYDKRLKALLHGDWQSALQVQKNDLSTLVMEIILHLKSREEAKVVEKPLLPPSGGSLRSLDRQITSKTLALTRD